MSSDTTTQDDPGAGEQGTSTSTSTTGEEEISDTSAGKGDTVSTEKIDQDQDAPISARRAKAMSIGNAASLFGTPNDDFGGVAGLFGGSNGSSSAATARAPAFDDIGEEAEESEGDPSSSSLSPQRHLPPAASTAIHHAGGLPSPNDDAAGLFGEDGTAFSSQVEWLGGGGSNSSGAAISSTDNIFAGQTSQQQDPSLYAYDQGQAQYGDAQYSYNNSNNYDSSYNHTQQVNGNHAYDYSQHYAGQGQTGQQQYGNQYDQPAVDNFSQSMYYDPNQQLQYQQTLQAQAHHPSQQQQQQYAQDAYGQQQQQYAPSAGQDQYASYYSQQDYADPQVNASTTYPQQASQYEHQTQQYANSYPSYPDHNHQQQNQPYAPSTSAQPQQAGYLQTQQSYQAPYSAPASSAQMDTLARSQSAQASHKQPYAQSYSAAYDPYAPSSNDPYGSQSHSMQPQASASSSSYSGHNNHRPKQPSLSSSKTAPNLAATLHPHQSAAGAKSDKKQDPKLNRSASSFFAELPPMPVKSRPASALGARGANQSMPPLPGFTASQYQQGVAPPSSIPPPPKSKSPLPPPAALSQRPPSRSKSVQSQSGQHGTNAWSPTVSAGTYSRPGSRTAERQGSLGSAVSQHSQPGTSRSSFESNGHSSVPAIYPGAQTHAQYPVNGNGGYATSAYTQDPYGEQPRMNGQYDISGSAPVSSRNSLDSHASYGKPPFTADQSTRAPSRPQSRQAQALPASRSPPKSDQPLTAQPRGPTTTGFIHDSRQLPSSAMSSARPPVPKAEPVSPPRVTDKPNQSMPDPSVEGLTALLQGQTLQDQTEDKAPGGAGQTQLSKAIATPLPPSEPDMEPATMSPSQMSNEWNLSLSPTSQRSMPLSPPKSSVPSLEVSAPSPSAETKPSIAMYVDGPPQDRDYAQEQEREVEEELLRAEREIKLEEEDEQVDRKPAINQLQDPESTASWSGTNAMYQMESDNTYSHEEQKPSRGQLQDAWQPESAAYDQGGYDPSPYGSDAAFAYGQSQAPSQPAHSSYDQYGAYEQQSSYGQPAAYDQPERYDQNRGYEQDNVPAPYSSDYIPQNMPQESTYASSYNATQPYQSYGQPSDDYNAYNAGVPAHAITSQAPPVHAEPFVPDGGDRRRNRPAVPIATFGFNGKLVTFFPSGTMSPVSAYGAAYGDSSPAVASIKIQNLSDLLPVESASLDSFPGPLFMDSIATSASGKAKKKKEVLAWLDSQISSSEQEKSYLGVQASDGQKSQADQKTIALRLVKILLENDGKLAGTAQLEQIVKQTLVPHINPDTPINGHFATAADLAKHTENAASAHGQAGGFPLATADDLDCLQTHLLKGDKQAAVQYALNNKLFGHAFVIASGTDKALLASVVKDFMAYELQGPRASGREALRVAYSLLGGGGSTAVQEFIPVTNTPSASPNTGYGSLQVQPAAGAPASRTPTPMIPLDCPSDISPDTLCKWQETAAMILANRSPSDVQALTGLGDVLVKNQWYKAGHACYLLSPTTSLLGGPTIPGVRWSLLGAANPLETPTSSSDIEAILLTEVIEFALSLVPTVKGQETFVGFPHLQAYRLLHARQLSEVGLHSKAQKYCDAIGSTLKLATKASPFYHPALLREVKELSDRLSMVSFQDKTGSWISRKVQRPTIDNVWSTLESRFAKFVTGDADEDPAQEERKRKANDAAKGVAGPFAHYSSITPQGPDSLSRNASYADLSMRTTPPPQPSSVPNTVSNATAAPKATHHRRSSSYAYGPYGADPYGSYVPQMPETAEEQEQPEQLSDAQSQSQQQQQQPYGSGYNEPQYGYVTPQNDSGWWSSANGGQESSPYGSSSSYGQAPTFSPVAEGYGSTDPQGLMSPMGFNNSPTLANQNFQPQPSKLQNEVTASASYGDDDDDLGLGNNSNKRKEATKQTSTESKPAQGSETPAEDSSRTDEPVRQTSSSSWLGRIFRRETASPTSAPIKAKLGEETSFVYDPVEKRWVNKKAGADTPPAAATPPPPRAQTASPSGYHRQEASSGTPPPAAMRATTASPGHSASRDTAPPPPSRPTSTAPPPATNPPPSVSTGATPPPRPATTTPSGELPPPPARKAGGAAAKKAVRSRYVDVFAQEQK